MNCLTHSNNDQHDGCPFCERERIAKALEEEAERLLAEAREDLDAEQFSDMEWKVSRYSAHRDLATRLRAGTFPPRSTD